MRKNINRQSYESMTRNMIVSRQSARSSQGALPNPRAHDPFVDKSQNTFRQTKASNFVSIGDAASPRSMDGNQTQNRPMTASQWNTLLTTG